MESRDRRFADAWRPQPCRPGTLVGRWQLRSVQYGGLSLVVPVRHGDEAYVLKVGWQDESTAHEALTLSAWEGKGAVRLFAAQPEVGAGDPEYGVAQLLWRRLEEMQAQGGLSRHFEALIEAAKLKAVRARAWTLVRCVDYWLWGVSVGLTEDPARCEAITDWLTQEKPFAGVRQVGREPFCGNSRNGLRGADPIQRGRDDAHSP